MTRDPARIDRILADLGRYWRANPDMRLAQIVVNACRRRMAAPHIFHTEDDVTGAWLAEHAPPEQPDAEGEVARLKDQIGRIHGKLAVARSQRDAAMRALKEIGDRESREIELMDAIAEAAEVLPEGPLEAKLFALIDPVAMEQRRHVAYHAALASRSEVSALSRALDEAHREIAELRSALSVERASGDALRAALSTAAGDALLGLEQAVMERSDKESKRRGGAP